MHFLTLLPYLPTPIFTTLSNQIQLELAALTYNHRVAQNYYHRTGSLVRRLKLKLQSRSIFALTFIFFCVSVVQAGQHSGMNMSTNETRAAGAPEVTEKILPGLGNWHHPISTKNAEAQAFFDQGLTLVYAFNFDEAKRSFQRASQLDPAAAMPYWGLALALGPSYNGGTNVYPATNEKEAYEALQKAKKLAAVGPENEREYIDALSKLFSADDGADPAKLAHDYIPAARDLKNKYPDDPDAATLYGAILMDLHTKKLWTPDGAPSEDTLEIVAVFEDVLRRWSDHPGANHLYIHTMEASSQNIFKHGDNFQSVLAWRAVGRP